MATPRSCCGSAELATPEQCGMKRFIEVPREVAECYDPSRKLRYAFLNDIFTPDDLKVCFETRRREST